MLEAAIKPEGNEDPEPRESVRAPQDDGGLLIHALLWGQQDMLVTAGQRQRDQSRTFGEIKLALSQGSRQMDSVEKTLGDVHKGIQQIIELLSQDS